MFDAQSYAVESAAKLPAAWVEHAADKDGACATPSPSPPPAGGLPPPVPPMTPLAGGPWSQREKRTEPLPVRSGKPTA